MSPARHREVWARWHRSWQAKTAALRLIRWALEEREEG